MEGVLWHVLASSRGGPTRAQIVRSLDERPRNANQLADDLGYDYTTIRHHLDVLAENNITKQSVDEYGAVYLLTETAETNRDTIKEIIETVDPGDSKK